LEFNSGGSGDILYAKLMKEEILKCDKELLKAAKQAGSIGGNEYQNKSAKIRNMTAITVSPCQRYPITCCEDVRGSVVERYSLRKQQSELEPGPRHLQHNVKNLPLQRGETHATGKKIHKIIMLL
jgi:hypothetical protein